MPFSGVLGPFFCAEESIEIRIVGERDPVILQKRKRNFLCGTGDRNGENLSDARLRGRTIFPCVCGDSLPVELAVENCEQGGVLSAFLHRDGHAIEIPLIIESGIFDELRVILVHLWLRCPRIELSEERRLHPGASSLESRRASNRSAHPTCDTRKMRRRLDRRQARPTRSKSISSFLSAPSEPLIHDIRLSHRDGL